MGGRIIATISGGLASAYVAMMALRDYDRDRVVLYFNDTGWEHPDLHRFLADIERHLAHPIVRDSDGRTVEDLAYDKHALPNNRMPFCSRMLKADRLRRFIRDGDTVLFGIGIDEHHRARRIVDRYADVTARAKIAITIRFPLIEHRVTTSMIAGWHASTGIARPVLYDLGFTHNNCSGGCVRQGRAAWALLYRTLPDVYAERERLEREMGEHLDRRVTFMNGQSLTELRHAIDASPAMTFDHHDDHSTPECVGVCATQQ